MLSINVTWGERTFGLTLSRYFNNCYYMGPDGRLREYPEPHRPPPPPRLESDITPVFPANYSDADIDRYLEGVRYFDDPNSRTKED